METEEKTEAEKGGWVKVEAGGDRGWRLRLKRRDCGEGVQDIPKGELEG